LALLPHSLSFLEMLTKSSSIESDVLAILGSDYSTSDVDFFINSTYTTQNYLPQFVKQSEIFQAGMPDCTAS
jgi:hypothetical protein